MANLVVIAIALLCSVQRGRFQETQCMSGFLDEDSLRNKAALIGRTVTRQREQVIITEIKFTCSGTLSKWIFVAESISGHRKNRYPELQVWRPQSTEIYVDFGMARDLEESTYYKSQGGQIPVRWTAPEALHYKKYSTASDVWSFGCLMYEIWSLGHKPFEGYTNSQVIHKVMTGWRLPPPSGCPREIYQLMIHCWHPDVSSRPQFSFLLQTLSQPEHELLHIPEEVSRGHPQASILGAPLEATKKLYIDLHIY